MWWALWTVLVVGTLVGAFYLGRSLWRRGVAFGREAARAAEVAGRLADRAQELAGQARERNPVPPPALGRDLADVRADLAAVQADRDRRKDERAARHRRTWERWLQVWR